MTTEAPDKDRSPTESVIYCIESNNKIDDLAHTMLHACTTVEEYTEKLNGLLRIFWGDDTPEGKRLDEVKWIEVIVQVSPTECLIPLFKKSMLQLDGKEYDNTEPSEPCPRQKP